MGHAVPAGDREKRRSHMGYALILAVYLLLPGPAEAGPKEDLYVSLDDIVPERVRTQGGDPIHIYGQNLQLISDFHINGVLVTDLQAGTTLPNGNVMELTCTAPPSHAGVVTMDYVITGQGPTYTTGLLSYFEWILVDAIHPNTGPRSGNAPCEILGDGFLPGEISSVTFGGVPASFNIDDSQTLSVTPPAAAQAGPVNVKVTHSSGLYRTIPFTYTDFAVNSLRPSTLRAAESSTVLIGGSGFDAQTTVLVDGQAPASTKVVSYDYLEIVIGPHAAGTADLTVTKSNGETLTLTGALRFSDGTGPRIVGIGPDSIRPNSVLGQFRIVGDGFTPEGVTRVSIGTYEVPTVEVKFDDQLEFPGGYSIFFNTGNSRPTAPIGTYADVTVVNPNGASDTLFGAVYFDKAIDSAPPLLALNGDNPILTPQDAPFTDPGATAIDAIDGDVSSLIDVQGTVNTAVAARYDLSYTATDTSRLEAGPITRTVYVEPPGTVVAPVPEPIPLEGFTAGRPGISVTAMDGAFNSGSTLTLDRPVGVPPFETPADPEFHLLPTTVYEIGGLDGLTNAGRVRVTIEYADGNQNGIVDDTSLYELDIRVYGLNDDGDTFVIVPDIDPVANTASFDIDASYLALGGAKSPGSLALALGGIQTQVPASSGTGLAVLVIAMLVALSAMRGRQRQP